ncbi:hypothetical protein SAMN06265375_1241 [Muriicola jejuensis]|nr:hypothetical protein SAMN06265375_1241 [Muriicola jejuensis]
MTIVCSCSTPGSIFNIWTIYHFGEIFNPYKAICIPIETMAIYITIISKTIAERHYVLVILCEATN